MIFFVPKINGTIGINKNIIHPGCQSGLSLKPISSANPKIRNTIRQKTGVAAIILNFNEFFISKNTFFFIQYNYTLFSKKKK